jgi:hypothetical protein
MIKNKLAQNRLAIPGSHKVLVRLYIRFPSADGAALRRLDRP